MLVYICLDHSNWKECPINTVNPAAPLQPEQALPLQKYKPCYRGRKKVIYSEAKQATCHLHSTDRLHYSPNRFIAVS